MSCPAGQSPRILASHEFYELVNEIVMCAESKGNNPVLWQKLLDEVEDKLQLGLLDHLRRVTAYHFEDDLLIIAAGTDQDREYFEKHTTIQTLKLFAEKVAGINRVRIDSSTTAA